MLSLHKLSLYLTIAVNYKWTKQFAKCEAFSREIYFQPLKFLWLLYLLTLTCWTSLYRTTCLTHWSGKAPSRERGKAEVTAVPCAVQVMALAAGIKLVGVPQSKSIHRFSPHFQDILTPRGSRAD